MDTQVRNAPERSRYELLIDGDLVGVADYRVEGDTIIFPHTEIDAPRRGHGLGSVLVKGALDDVRGTGRTVIARCWFVRDFIEDHAGYQDMLSA